MIPAAVIQSDSLPDTSARAWVDVDLDAVVANGRHVARVAGRRLLPMVKANGYGLGAGRIVGVLESLDPWGYGVATLEEGAALRSAGIGRPVLVFTPLTGDWVAAALRYDLRPVLCDLQALGTWLAAAGGQPFHLGIDTGMARAGLAHDDVPALAACRALLAGATGYEGVCTHFHSADGDPAATARQWSRFEEAITALGPRPPMVHAANSAAALQGTPYAADLVRPGIFLYGGRAGDATPATVAALRARVIAVRAVPAGATVGYGATWRPERAVRLATLAIGYADGVLRSLSNRGSVELAGRLAPIRGSVTMDMTMVEAPESVRVGDIATVYGGLVSLDTQAAAAGTISYELLTSLGPRVHRRYGAAS